MCHALGIYDLLRVDHFRGFDTYWAIPATGTTFVVGCLDLDGGQLAEQMRNIYAEMPHECVTSRCV